MVGSDEKAWKSRSTAQTSAWRVTAQKPGQPTWNYPLQVAADIYGDAEVRKLIKSRVLPYVITGEMKADLFAEPYEFKGNINLPPSK